MQDFERIRIGIGRPARDSPDAVTDHVLGHFTAAEAHVLQQAVFPSACLEVGGFVVGNLK